MIVIFGYLYVIGGFKSLKEEEINVCNDVKLIKIDSLMTTWTDFHIEGCKPKNIISPSIHFIFKRFLVAVSSYCELNIFILDLIKKKGITLDLRISFIKDIELCNKIYFYNGKFFFPEYKEKNQENVLNLYEINISS